MLKLLTFATLAAMVGDLVMYGTRTSRYWEATPGKFDMLNLRHVCPSSSPYDIPDLNPCHTVPADLAAWNVARQREYAADNAGAIHFFLDDYRFETAWSSPERSLTRVAAVGTTLTPDFSLWRDMPTAAQIWQIYRSRWCGAYWQANGVTVIPTACWSTPDSYRYCFDGLPIGGNVAISAVGIRADTMAIALFRQGVAELVDRVQPDTILVYGKLRHCDDIDLPAIREYPTFWDRRRRKE